MLQCPFYQKKKLELNWALANYQFSGGIPSEISSLSSLTYLNLLGNSLTGAITAELNRMGQLQVLDLSMNNTASLQHN
jgi:hypothetical protein